MKRKIFSKLLMVALVIAAVGSFVSCKDYDDDINNLQKQIDAKAAISELTALQSTLEGKISTATAAAQKAAEDAAAKADASLKAALETAIADAKKAGTDAGTQAGTAIAAANKAQETADGAAAAAKKADEDAKAALADALKAIEETYQTKAEAAAAAAKVDEAIADVKAIADAAFTKAEAEKLQEQVDGLKAELEAAIDEKIDAKIQEVNNAVASVDAIWKAVTSIELVPHDNLASTPGYNYVVKLLTGTEVANKFGADVAPAGNVVRTYGAATEGEIQPVDYTAGKEIEFDNRVIIRVNPANAEVNKEDIILINSKGESLEELVDIVKVEDYKQLITTRADYATGLKVVSIVRKAGVTDDQIAEATTGNKIKATERPISKAGTAAYAIGVKNGEENRILYTTFGLKVTYGDYTPLFGLNFVVKGDANGQDWQEIKGLKNRWDGTQLVGEDETREYPVAGKWYADVISNVTDKNKGIDRVYVDTLSTDGKGTDKNYNDGSASEKRQGKNAYVIVDESSRSFTVNLNDLDKFGDNWKVQYYYVVLDKYAAVESAPSEYQSWKKYTYTGLNTITPATDPLTVSIDDEAAIGDIIGFRVIAVNYDGSLVDLDGSAFYVKVGDVTPVDNTKTIPVTFKAIKKIAAADANVKVPETILADAKEKDWNKNYNSNVYDFEFTDDYKDYDLSKFSGSVSKTYAATGTTIANVTGEQTVTVYYWLLKSKDLKGGKVQLATSASEVKYVLTSADLVGSWVNNATVTEAGQISVTDPNHHDNEVAKLGLVVSKSMPEAPTFTWVTGREPVGGVLTIYPEPYSAGAVNYEDGTVAPFAQFIATQYGILPTGLTPAQQAKFVLSIKKAKKAATDAQQYVANAFFTGAGATVNTIVPTYPNNNTDAALYGANVFKFNTPYTATCTYNYVGISITKVDKDNAQLPADFEAPVGTPTVSSVKFVDRLATALQTYGWNSYNYYVGNTVTAKPASVPTDRVAKTSSTFFLVWDGVTTAKAGTAIAAANICKFGDAVDYTGAAGLTSNATMPDIKIAVESGAAGGANLMGSLWSNNSANLTVPVGGINTLLTQTVYSSNMAKASYSAIDFGGLRRFAVKVIANGQEYYTGTLTSTKLTLAQNNTILPPASNLDAKLYVYAADRFGLNLNSDWSGLADEDDWTPIMTLDLKIFKNQENIVY